jgi:hypothetical protein
MGRRGKALPLLEGMQGYISLFIGQEQGARLLADECLTCPLHITSKHITFFFLSI